MARRRKREIFTGLEIGTATIKVVLGEFMAGDMLAVLGVSEVPSLKVVKGEVIEVPVVHDQVLRALNEAENASGEEIQDVFVAVTGGHIESLDNTGSTLVQTADKTIREDDVVTAVRTARACSLSPDKEILHYIDREYVVDGNREVANPLGMVGTRLDAYTHIVYGQHNRIQTSRQLVAEIMGEPPAEIAFSGMAAAFAAFTPDDMSKGALLIDIGAGTTEYVVFRGPGCSHSGVFTVGCNQVVNDLALGLRLPPPRARQILMELGEFGSAVWKPDGRSRMMEIANIGQKPRQVPVSTVEQIIELRLQELLELIQADLQERNLLSRIGSEVVLCGGGSRIPGVLDLARRVFDMPVRQGTPQMLGGSADLLSSPQFVVPIGLIRLGRIFLAQDREEHGFWETVRTDARRVGRLLKDVLQW